MKNLFDLKKLNPSHKPLMQRPVTWIVMSILLITTFTILKAVDGLNYLLATEKKEGTVKNFYYTIERDVEQWGTDRKYNKSSVPSCAWDIDEDETWVCTATDTLGNCTDGYYDYDYDYSMRDWVKFTTLDTTIYSSLNVIELKYVGFNNKNRYQYKHQIVKYYLKLSVDEQPVEDFELRSENGMSAKERFILHARRGKTFNVKVRKRNGKLLRVNIHGL